AFLRSPQHSSVDLPQEGQHARILTESPARILRICRVQTDAAPATVKQLCEYYVLDLERRGKGPESITRAVTTAKAIEAVAPSLLMLPVSRVTARDVYDFRQARLRAGSKPSTIIAICGPSTRC